MLEAQNAIRILSPVKLKKGQKEIDSSDKLYSRAVSRIRQAIESFFSWIQEKTGIQNNYFSRSGFFSGFAMSFCLPL